MQKRLSKPTKPKLRTMIKLLEESGHKLLYRKLFSSSLCFSLATAFANALDGHFHCFECDSLQSAHTYLQSYDERGRREILHVWHSASFSIDQDTWTGGMT